jgi:DNA-binding HxlR family transcriptional regulator
MTLARTYGDPCAAARALDLIGERWALMIVRELLYGAKRYSDLQSGLPHASPTVLSQRLRDLEEGGVIQRRKLGAPARVWVYELTEWGRQLQPMLVFLGRWGRRSPVRDTTISLGVDSVMLALQSHLDPAQLDGLDTTVAVQLGEDLFTLHVGGGELVIQRGEPAQWDVAVRTDTATFKAMVISKRTIDELGERVEVTGDLVAFQRLLNALA